ncbi:hypothetical protein ABC733_25210 [Mangrovibacter sp. SLW1]
MSYRDDYPAFEDHGYHQMNGVGGGVGRAKYNRSDQGYCQHSGA